MANKHIQLKDPEGNLLFAKTKGEDIDVTKDEIKIMGTNLGALSDGDVIPADISLPEFLKMISQKQVLPTYSSPSITLVAVSGTGIFETGSTISSVVKATFYQKDAGALEKIEFLKGEETIEEISSNPANCSVPEFILEDGTTPLSAIAYWENGPIKEDNFGVPYPTGQILAGNKKSNIININGVRKLFYSADPGKLPELTSSHIRELDSNILNPTTNMSFDINIEVGDQHIIFAYPSSLRDVHEVEYVEANDINMGDSFIKHLINVADARGGEMGMKEYKVYTYQMASPAQAEMTFKVTI